MIDIVGQVIKITSGQIKMNEIEKYIKESMKSTDEASIKRELAAKGYNPEDYNYMFQKVSSKNVRLIYYSVVFGILVVALLLRFFLVDFSQPPQGPVLSQEEIYIPQLKDYSQNPKDWIENRTLSLEQATQGKGVLEGDSLKYLSSEYFSAFTYDGYYQGEYFTRKIEGKIEITNELNSEDGIPQIMIVNRLEGNNSKVLIFVDEDWKKKVVPNNIWWGINFENNKIFDYSNEIAPGIYLDEIDDSNRFIEGFNVHFGGVAVGDITQQKIDNQEINVTYVRVR